MILKKASQESGVGGSSGGRVRLGVPRGEDPVAKSGADPLGEGVKTCPLFSQFSEGLVIAVAIHRRQNSK